MANGRRTIGGAQQLDGSASGGTVPVRTVHQREAALVDDTSSAKVRRYHGRESFHEGEKPYWRSVYILESANLFKIGSSGQPSTRCETLYHLADSDGTVEAVDCITIAPLIAHGYQIERHLQDFVFPKKHRGRVQEVFRNGVSLKFEDACRHLDFGPLRVIPNDTFAAYVSLIILAFHLGTGRSVPSFAGTQAELFFWEECDERGMERIPFPWPMGVLGREPSEAPQQQVGAATASASNHH